MEIDCWDGKDQPVVTHGMTFCLNLGFEDLIRDLQPLAFKYSEYPLVLSLEMHCSRPKRDMIASVLTKYFPTELFYLTKEDFFARRLPPLSELMNKVLIKCKSKYPTFVTSKIGASGKVPMQNLEVVHIYSYFEAYGLSISISFIKRETKNNLKEN